jgi:serine/threonine protein kinase
MGNIDVEDLLPQVRVPTLVLHCKDEAGVPFEEGRLLAASIPGARFVPLEGRNHLLLEGAQSWGKFVKEVRQFLGMPPIPESADSKVQPNVNAGDHMSTLHQFQTPKRYSVISSLGRGGMGEVFLAEDTKLGRKVALKTLPPEFTNNKDRLRRFQQEARSASALNHPNIMTIYEIGIEDGLNFIASEHIDGETLRVRLKHDQLRLDDILDVAQQTAFALSAAHEAGIVHRDIKPENIMLRRDGIVKVLDFGLAKLTEESLSVRTAREADLSTLVQTSPGTVMGTLEYMSPEQARAEETDERTDVWSLGCVIYEMVTGQGAFARKSGADTLAAILGDEPLPLSRYAPEVPDELQRIVTRTLQKKRSERYQTARELLTDIRSLRQEREFRARLESGGWSGQRN